MASKSFYTLDEAAKRLGKTASEINAMADKGQLTRVNHEGQIKFRVEQVEVLASDDDALDLDADLGPIGLADSGSAAPIKNNTSAAKKASALDDSVLGLAGSGSGMGLAGSGERTGVSAASGRGKGDAVEIGLETVGSGSGLLDLTRESEETALGAELIEQVYSNDSGGSGAGSSGIFAAAAMETSEASSAPMSTGMMVAEAYDGAWSGAGLGMMIAAVAGLVVAALIIVTAGMGSGSLIAANFSDNLIAWAGSLGGLVAVFGLVGFFVGRATE